MNTKTIQTKVILGEGAEDFFTEVDFEFPKKAELFMIENVTKWVDVYDAKVVGGNKVIFNAWIYKNIAYKTVDCIPHCCHGSVTVTGDIKHITKRMPLAGCIAINPECGIKLCDSDIAEVLCAEVLGDVEDLLCPIKLDGIEPCMYVYGKLHEKMCVRIKIKVVRWEHLDVCVEE